MTDSSEPPTCDAADGQPHQRVPLLALFRVGGLDDEDRTRLHATGAHAAESGTPLHEVIDAHLRAQCQASRPAAGPEAPVTPAHVVRLVRDVAVALTEGYESAHRAAIRREKETRHAFIDELLRGPGDLGRMAEQAHRIGFQLTGPHRVAVARAKTPFTAVEPGTRYVNEAMSARRYELGCLVTAKDGLLVCVAGGSGPAACEAFAEAVTRSAVRHPLIAVSRPRPGANGVVRSFREALETLELADRLALPRRVIHAADLLVFQVLGRDRAAITDLVATVLGGLEQARGGPGPLLRTLTAYFDSGCAHTVTARRLGLSVRAVTYRLARIRTLTGYDPALPDERYTLQTAALGARLLNWPSRPLQPVD
ncbi:PucR family transcriptional regulator [Streptomyces sp. T028]|uniref:PucR family transcriptional regulator n=1 Tax=Streptomyces sp. T028 TaxID=3394379 RepID=UPI003A8B5633